MEDYDEYDQDLEDPIFINDIERSTDITTGLLHKKGDIDVQPDQKQDAQTGKPVEHPGKHGSTAPVAKPLEEANRTFLTHGASLWTDLVRKYYPNSLIGVIRSTIEKKCPRPYWQVILLFHPWLI